MKSNKKRVVIADDSITVQKLVNLTLAGLNFEVITSMDGHDALMKIKRLKPDLVLADTELQDVAGVQLCEQVRSSSELIDTRLVLMHNTQGEGSSNDIDGAPFDFLLEKPFDSKTLIGVVQKVLSEEPSTTVRDQEEVEEEAKENFEQTEAPEEEPSADEDSSSEEETVTQKAEGLFSSFRKAEGAVDLNSKLSAIAAEVLPSSDSDDSQAEPVEERAEETIDERLASAEEEAEETSTEKLDPAHPTDHEETKEEEAEAESEAEPALESSSTPPKESLVTEEEEQESAEQLYDALDEVSKVSNENDLASHDLDSEEMQQIAREEIRAWLDKHLRPMVEDVVKEELAKITEDQES